MMFLKNTKSLCPVCLKIIEAKVITNNNKVYIVKECKEHGKFKYLHVHDDLEIYRFFQELDKINNFRAWFGTIDLTYKCNLNCPFCCNFGGEKENYEPGIEEIRKKQLKLSKYTMTRPSPVMLFGGEPTLRRDLFDIIKALKGKGHAITLATNGLKLTSEYTKKLKLAGLSGVLLQFDGLDKNIYKIIRGRDILKEKLNAISNFKKAGIDIHIFVTLVKDVNDNQIGKIISYAASNSPIKVIDFVPFCPEGRLPEFKVEKLTNSEILNEIKEETGITKDDFLECTEFSQALAGFIGKIYGKPFFGKRFSKKLFTTTSERNYGKIIPRAPKCTLVCRVLSEPGKLTPLNRIIELKKIIKILEKGITIFEKEHKLAYLKLTIYLLWEMFKLVITDKSYLNFVLINLKNYFFKGKRRFIEIAVWSFNNRYNADFNLIKYCNNITEMPDGGIGGFCLKNILQTQIMRGGEYKFNREEI